MNIPCCAALALGIALSAHTTHAEEPGRDHRLRIATFNLKNVNSRAMARDRERMRRLGAVIRDIDPDIILLNEIAYGPMPGGEGEAPPLLAEVFTSGFIDRSGTPQASKYRVFAAPVNTGVPSGFDLDNNGTVAQEQGSRDYGGDCFGFGTFPGEYGMAVLVRKDLPILEDQSRTFQTFLWKDMPGAMLPAAAGDGQGGWYSDEELGVLRLSSKSHWDVPVRLPDGRVLHVLASHPTPPVFDGPEDRNGKRNHDEIRFWRDYIDGAAWIYDDAGVRGGLAPDALFVVLGDLNADPDEGDSAGHPTKELLLDGPRVQGGITPVSRVEEEGLDPDDTSHFRLRVDYVLASAGLDIVGFGVVRGLDDLPVGRAEAAAAAGATKDGWWGHEFPSDHYPVWVDVAVGGAHGMGKGE